MRNLARWSVGSCLVVAFAATALADPGPSDYSRLDPARQGHLLSRGASGAEVTALQNALAGVCHPVPLTGAFDAATVAAVESFQTVRRLGVDGIVGPETMGAFDVALGIASSPSPGLTRIQQSQVTPAITQAAVAILAAHWSDDIGTEVPFTANAKSYVGRIELHFHPFGGSMKPWGYHHGVSVYSGTIAAAPAPVASPAPAPAAGSTPLAGLLPRAASAPTGSEFMSQTAALSIADREAAIWDQLSTGNVPDFLRTYVDVTTSAGGHTVVFHVLPDYMAIGSDDDFVRIPLEAPTAQRIADLCSASLPTRKMVNLIWSAATEKVAPQPLPPTAQMTSNAWFSEEQAKIEAELVGQPRGQLVAGDKKDVVITNLLVQYPDRVAIYGWQQLTGQPIQPLTIVHAATYADYSHGTRLVSQDVILDGQPAQLDDVLRDPTLSVLLSDEGPIASPRYP